MQIAFFMHTVQTKANSIRFAHQSLCSPRISTLLKAIRCSFLKGCPNLSAAGVTRYLNPSPATAKGHMKWPRMGIHSTRQIKWKKLSNNNHFITLQIDGHSPNLFASNYITKVENIHSKTSLKKVIIQRHHQ
jgi:hypothetical protein